MCYAIPMYIEKVPNRNSKSAILLSVVPVRGDDQGPSPVAQGREPLRRFEDGRPKVFRINDSDPFVASAGVTFPGCGSEST